MTLKNYLHQAYFYSHYDEDSKKRLLAAMTPRERKILFEFLKFYESIDVPSASNP